MTSSTGRVIRALATATVALVASVLVAGSVAMPAATSGVAAPVVTGAGTVSGDATYSVNSVRLPNSTISLRWNPCQARVTYKINASYAGTTAAARASAIADTREAFRRLENATGIHFVYTGTTVSVPSGSAWSENMKSAEIVVAWVRPSGLTLLSRDANGNKVAATGGYAYKTWAYPGQPWKGVIGRGFVVVNQAQQSAFKTGFGTGVTRGNLLLHELGHVVGLNHTAATSQLMYPVIVSRTNSGYRGGDLTGLSLVGAHAGCVAVPAGMYTDL